MSTESSKSQVGESSIDSSGSERPREAVRRLSFSVGVGAGPGDTVTFALPAGTVTFLLSDIEGSTRLWEAHPDAMRRAVPRHYEILSEAVARHDGVRPVEQGEGDSVVAAFSRASDAAAAALDAQLALHVESWPEGIELGVRIALHTAEAQLRDEGNYFGVALSRCARIRAIARGGQTLVSHPTHDLVVDLLPDGAELVDCGEHRLRDLSRPEVVFALVHPGLPSVDPAQLRSLDKLPNNLPVQLTSFIGRVRELAELREALANTRMLTLTGAGGSGKTRLALQLAADALDGFPDGVWWVELAPVTEPELVGEATARALGVRPLAGMTNLDAVCRYLAHRCAVVVLDNCEHLLDACADAATALLEACPEVTVLATSRASLGVGGETDWRVPALSLPRAPASESIEVLTQSDAVRLFIERAIKVRSNFSVTNETAPHVAQICSDLDGIPLAIELAAARVRVMSVEQITQGLADRFHRLTGGARSALPRQQTLRASVDWSHDLLSDEDRALFRRLGAFIGGFTLDAAEAVCADSELDRYRVLDVLSSLVEKSLVVAEESHGAIRYGMLETVRQYAVERLEQAGDRAALSERHLRHFAELAAESELAFVAPGSEPWLELLDSETPNLTITFDYALGTDPEAGLRIAVALVYYWTLRGRLAEGIAAYTAALAATPAPSALRARALWARSWLLMRAGDGEGAVASAQESLVMAESFGDRSTAARAIDVLGVIQFLGDPAGAVETLAGGIALAEQAGDEWALTMLWQDVGLSRVMQDRDAEATAAFAQVYPIVTRLELAEGECWHWFGAGYFGLNTGDRTRLRAGLERCRDRSIELREPLSLGMAAVWLLHDDVRHGCAETGLAEASRTLEQVIAQGAGLAVPYLLAAIACAQASLGLLAEGEAALADVEAQTQGALASLDQWGYSIRAQIARLSGQLDRAETYAAKALEVAAFTANEAYQATAKLAQARIAAARGNHAAAESAVHEAIDLALADGFRPVLADALAALAVVAAGLESHEEAARLLGASDRALDDLDGSTRWRDDKSELDELRARLEAELGPEPYAEGRELSLENAIGWARRARGQRKRPSGGWESLTSTELRVVELASEGLTNAAIGKQLFMSPATVKVHLAHIYGKLDVPNRAALATAAAGRRAASDLASTP